MISIIIELSGGHSKKSVRKTHSTVFTVWIKIWINGMRQNSTNKFSFQKNHSYSKDSLFSKAVILEWLILSSCSLSFLS